MKTIEKEIVIGIDAGVRRTGYAVIETSPAGGRILESGVVECNSSKNSSEFMQGKNSSATEERATAKSERRQYRKKKKKRRALTELLNGIFPAGSFSLPKNEEKILLWEARANAAERQIPLADLWRVLYMFTRRRGYRFVGDETEEMAEGKKKAKKDGDWLNAIRTNDEMLRANGQTIGQYMYSRLAADPHFRIKNTIFSRQSYAEEFEAIMSEQVGPHPDEGVTITEEQVAAIREAIFFQAPLRSCKHLVSRDAALLRSYKKADGTTVKNAPRVAHKSSPICQACRLWEAINNLYLTARDGEVYRLTDEDRGRLYDLLNENASLSKKEVLAAVHPEGKKKWSIAAALPGRGIKGNETLAKLRDALGGTHPELLEFDLTKYIVKRGSRKEISPDYEKEPLFRLWHDVYSIKDREEIEKTLRGNYGIEEEDVIERILKINFSPDGYSNKSVRQIRSILPYLMTGRDYYHACKKGGVETPDRKALPERAESVATIRKNDEKNPAVLRSANAVVSVVNRFIKKYPVARVNIQFARELCNGAAQREAIFKEQRRREKENEKLRKELTAMGVTTVTNRHIRKLLKYRETGGKCMYCGKEIDLMQFLNGEGADLEHIIPRSKLINDAYHNFACSCIKCDRLKKERTAIDFIRGEAAYDEQEYVDRVNALLKAGKIPQAEADFLLMSERDIPEDNFSRLTSLTGRTARLIRERIEDAGVEVMVSSNIIASTLRKWWGYDDELERKCIEVGGDRVKTVTFTREKNGVVTEETHIEGWNRNRTPYSQAVDAVATAQVTYRDINKFNLMSRDKDTPGQSLGEYVRMKPHINRKQLFDALETCEYSVRANRKPFRIVAHEERRGSRKVKTGGRILVPAGALHEGTLYGKAQVRDDKPCKAAKLFKNAERIENAELKAAVLARLDEFKDDVNEAKKSIKKRPLTLGGQPVVEAYLLKTIYTVKKDVMGLTDKQVESIIEPSIREIVKVWYKKWHVKDPATGKMKLSNNAEYPVGPNGLPIRRVKVNSRLSDGSVARIEGKSGNPDRYVKTGSNYCTGYYTDENGKEKRVLCTLLEANMRKRYHIPIMPEDPAAFWKDADSSQLPPDAIRNYPKAGWKHIRTVRRNDLVYVDKEKGNVIGNVLRVQKMDSSRVFYEDVLMPEKEKEE